MTRSRRDLLKALAALAPLSCVGRPAGRTIEGSIVGGAYARGHRLRDGRELRPGRREETEVVIIGRSGGLHEYGARKGAHLAEAKYVLVEGCAAFGVAHE